MPYNLFIALIVLIITQNNLYGKTSSELYGELKPLGSLPYEQFVDLVSKEDYEGALRLADSLIKDDPSSLGGYFLALTALNNRSIDYEDDEDLPALVIVADSISSIADRRIANGDNSALLCFYRGSVEGFLMIHDLRSHNYFEAIIHGQRAAALLERSLDIDSTLYDAYVGLGNYYYFKSRYGGVLRSTGIISDRREEGKRLLRIASDQGLLTRLAGSSSLAWIAIDEENFDLAIEYAKSQLALYPENRAFLWCLGRAQMKSERWSEAILTYTALLNSVRKLSRNNHYNEISCLHSLAQASSHIHDWQSVVTYAEEALDLKIDPEIASKKEDDIKRLKFLRIEGRNKLAQRNNK